MVVFVLIKEIVVVKSCEVVTGIVVVALEVGKVDVVEVVDTVLGFVAVTGLVVFRMTDTVVVPLEVVVDGGVVVITDVVVTGTVTFIIGAVLTELGIVEVIP